MTLISFPYFQKEQKKLGMMKVYSDRFCWKKSKSNEMLIVQMRMEDFISASEPVIIMISLLIIIVRKNCSDILFFHQWNLIYHSQWPRGFLKLESSFKILDWQMASCTAVASNESNFGSFINIIVRLLRFEQFTLTYWVSCMFSVCYRALFVGTYVDQ